MKSKTGKILPLLKCATTISNQGLEKAARKMTTLAELLRQTATEYLNSKLNSENVTTDNENPADKPPVDLNFAVSADGLPVLRVAKSQKKRVI